MPRVCAHALSIRFHSAIQKEQKAPDLAVRLVHSSNNSLVQAVAAMPVLQCCIRCSYSKTRSTTASNTKQLRKSNKEKRLLTDSDVQRTTTSPTLDSGVNSPFPGDIHLR